MQQRDYIERLIEQLAAVIASAFGVGGQTREPTIAETQQKLDEAWLGNVGLRRSDAERLDDVTLRTMLGSKAILAAALFDAQARVEEICGRDDAAARFRRRASSLRA